MGFNRKNKIIPGGKQMTEKEAKKELYSYLHSKKLEERKLDQIEEVKARLTKITSVLSDMPKRNTRQ